MPLKLSPSSFVLGKKQRSAIARALAVEPTSALDPELVEEVSTKVVFLHQGLVEEEGSQKEVFDNPKSERVK